MEDIAIKSNHNLLKTAPDLLFISLSNYGYVEMTENHLISLKRNNIDNHIAFVLDEESYEVLSNKGYNVSLYKNINKINSHEFGSVDFDEITFIRWEIISQLLRADKTVWYLDIDVVVLDNLNKSVQEIKNKEFCAQNDINMACAGCMLFFPTVNTITLTIIMYANRNTEGIINDQILLNNILHNNSDKLKLHILDHNLFPNGLLYFSELHENPLWRNIQEIFRKNPSQAKLVHANWMTGKDTKIKALKDKNLWYI
jgi:hypothetical protein